MGYAGCTAESRRDVARVVRSAKKIIGAELPDLDSVWGPPEEEGKVNKLR